VSVSTLLDKTLAIARRDLLTAVRYRTGFLLGAAGAITELAAFYYLSRAVGPNFRPEGEQYFCFLVVGTGFYTFLLMGVHAFLQTVQEAQRTGTLEVLMTTSTSPPVLVFLSAISAFTANTFTLAFYLAAGLALFGAPFQPNVGAAIAVFLLSVVVAGALGLLAAALQLAIQKGSALVWALGSVWFLTGTMFPVSTPPKPLRYVSELIPVTHCLDGMRLALLEGAPWSAVVQKLVILGLFGAVLVPASLLVFSWTLRRARLQGTLSFY